MLCLLSPTPAPNQLSAGERRGPKGSRNVNFFFPSPFSYEHVRASRCIGVKAWEGEEFTETRLGFWLRCRMLSQKENTAHRQEVTHRPHLQQLHTAVVFYAAELAFKKTGLTLASNDMTTHTHTIKKKTFEPRTVKQAREGYIISRYCAGKAANIFTHS